MPLSDFLRFLGRVFARTMQAREYNFDPPHLSLFDPTPSRTPCDPSPPETGPRLVLRGPAIAPCVFKRSEELSFSLSEMPRLAIDVRYNTTATITGTDAGRYHVRFCAQAGGADEDDARRILRKITLVRAGQWLKLKAPQSSRERSINAWLRIEAARHCALTVRGAYSYVEIFDIDAPVHVSTTHARMKLFEVAGEVQATANVGIIDFAGNRGLVQLNADGEIGEINLKVTAPRFEGTLYAQAEVAIRVLLPPEFQSPFEAIVNRPELFVCRADIAPGLRRRDRDGHAVFTYGPADPVLRFVSHGALVIDSTDRLRSNRS